MTDREKVDKVRRWLWENEHCLCNATQQAISDLRKILYPRMAKKERAEA